jgi:uncharacterized tellurite resistance protein B-like protein
MSFYELFKKGYHSSNLGHFAAIVNIANIDGKIDDEELALIKRLALKLGVENSEYEEILKDPGKYPILPSNSVDERLERIHDLFDIIFTDHEIDSKEFVLIKKYAIALGFDHVNANELIQESIKIYSGKLSVEEYKYLLNKRLNK